MPSTPPPKPQASMSEAGPWGSKAVDAASHGAIAFCQIYYEAYDEPTRRATLHHPFFPTAISTSAEALNASSHPHLFLVLDDSCLCSERAASHLPSSHIDQEIPLLYLPSAKILWNGNVVPSDRPGLSAFLEGVPLSRHDLQTLDCHPVAVLDPTAGPAPDLIVNVTGSVVHGPSVMRHSDNQGSVRPQDMPRKFHEMFMLRAAEQGENMQPKYAIHSSNFRFTG